MNGAADSTVLPGAPPSRGWVPLAVIAGTSLLCHGLLILNDGIFWDGWLIQDFVKAKNWEILSRGWDSAGTPGIKWVHWGMGVFPNFILAYRIAGFIAITLAAVLVYLVAVETTWLSRQESTWLSLLSLTYPAQRLTIEFSYIPYAMFYCLFVAAVLLALHSERRRGLPHWVLRALSLFLFYLSFNLNSLLVLFGGFALILIARRRSLEGGSIREAFQWLIPRRLDYWMLPFLFWILKESLTPRSGLNKHYNEFNLNPALLLFHVGAFVGNTLYSLNDALRALLQYPVVALSLLLLLYGVHQRIGRRLSAEAAILRPREALGMGLFLAILGMAPYVVVGLGPSLEGVGTRHAILMALPVSLILLGAVKMLGNRAEGGFSGPGLVCMVLLIVGSGLSLINNYISWQARWAKDRSLMAQLSGLRSYEPYSVFWIRDRFPVGGEPAYRYYEWAALFKAISGRESRIGLDVRHHTQQDLSVLREYFTDEYALSQFDPKGPQAVMTILPGANAGTDATMAGKYLYRRFLRPEQMDQFLLGLTEIRIEPCKDPGAGK
jgi:hypothetical protein